MNELVMKKINILNYIFKATPEKFENVARINIYLLRLLYGLTIAFVGTTAWEYLLTFEGTVDPLNIMAYCVWASYATLSIIGLFNPLKMLPLVMFQIFYKTVWLAVVAFPLWRTNQLIGSPAEEMTYPFLWVILPIIAIPWKYVFNQYIKFQKAK